MIKKPDITTDELIEIVPGPDFPTAGIICGRNGIRNAYEHGRGSIIMRGRTTVEEHPKTGRKSIVATEIPYQVNKAKLIEKIAELVRDKRIEGIADMRDESDRDGMRIVIDLKKDAVPEIVQNNLWKMTQLQESFGINMLAIVDGRPQILSLKQALLHYIAHRRDVVTRRTMFDLREARDRMHILEGLKIAVDNIDAVIDLIRASKDTEAAKTGLMQSFDLSARQAQAILDMRLAKLTGLERDALIAEIKEVGALIARLEAILENEQSLMAVVTGELEEIKKEYGDERRTELQDIDIGEIDVEDMIAPEEMVVTVTHGGYVKRSPKTLYRAQRRGGRGITGAATHEEDFVAQLFVASTHDTLLMLTNKGRAYSKKVWEVPQAGRTAKGKAFVNLIPLQEGERVVALLPVREFSEGAFVVMATRLGQIKKTSLDAFGNIRVSGIIALTHRRRRRSGRGAHHRGDGRPPAGHAQRLGDPLPRGERPADGPHGARRARHPAANGSGRRRRGRRHGGHPARGAGDAADRVREGLRQAHADVGLPDQEPRRQGRHHHQDHRTQRQGGRPAPGHRRRRPDVDHRRRQADPHAGRRHPDHRPQHAGRAPDPPGEAEGERKPRRWSPWSASPRRKKAARSRPRWRPRAPSWRRSRWPRRIWATRAKPKATTTTRARTRAEGDETAPEQRDD